MKLELEKAYAEMLEEHHSKCPFCGRHNGRYDRVLEQHGPRCRYKGDASSFEVSIPNYYTFIDQDDKDFLPHMWAAEDLSRARRRIVELERESKKDDAVP